MPKKSNLEIAFENQVKSLEGTQREMVKAEMDTWKWNKKRIRDIESLLETSVFEKDKDRDGLINERHKLVTENTSLYSHINRALKGTITNEDELDAFLAGK